MVKVSIIIPAYNVEQYIEKCVCSALQQTERNIEIIVVDDGSTDNTGKLISDLAKKDERLVFIQQKNTGVSGARNNGIRHSTGEYFMFLDSDDWLEDNAVKELLDALPDDKDVLVCSECYFVEYKNDKIEKIQQGLGKSRAYIERDTALLNLGNLPQYKLQSSCYKLFKRKVIAEKQIKFNESIHYGEDGLFTYEYLLNMSGIIYIPSPLWNILDRPGSATKSTFNSKMLTALTAIDLMLEVESGVISENVINNLEAQKAERAIWILNKYLLDNRSEKQEFTFVQKELKKNSIKLVKRNKSLKTLLQCIIMQSFPENALRVLIRFKNRRKQ